MPIRVQMVNLPRHFAPYPLADVPLLTCPNISSIIMTMPLMKKSYQAYGSLTAAAAPSNPGRRFLPQLPPRGVEDESRCRSGRHELQAKEVITRSSQRV
jgi:hypothetical protein